MVGRLPALRRRMVSVTMVGASVLALVGAAPAVARNCQNGDPVGSGFSTSLRAANGRWVSAELGYTGSRYGMLRARATAIGPWERFYVLCLGNQHFALRASNGRWVSAEMGYTGSSYAMLRARATSIGPWEQFMFYPLDGDYIGDGPMTFASLANHRTVSAELGYGGGDYGMLRARDQLDGGYSGSWEIFTAVADGGEASVGAG